MLALKLIAALLNYPEQSLTEAAAELTAALEADGDLTRAEKARIKALVAELRTDDLLELQARYVETFDRGRARSLHLFEHVHGESRDRGQAMVDLMQVYRQHGFEMAHAELPDYLPLFLEFLSQIGEAEARQWLGEVAHILQLLHARLDDRASPYAALFEPLLRLGGAEARPAEVDRQVRGEERDDTPEALDEAWAEEPVTFGLGATACPSARPQRAVPVQWANPRQAQKVQGGVK